MPDRTAALAEPMAVAVTGLMRGRVDPGDTVVVVGPGPVGILSAVAARAAGATEVIVVGREPSDRLRFAGSLGLRTATAADAEALARELTAGRGADLVIEATGTESGIAIALAAVRRRGRVVAVGMSGRPEIAVQWDLAVTRAIDVAFSMSSSGTAWDPALAILAGAGQSLESMTTVFALADWEVAFGAVADRTVIKALIDPQRQATR
jgi:threonine dehydrogenase-like Zn-dependent dehydrogenase